MFCKVAAKFLHFPRPSLGAANAMRLPEDPVSEFSQGTGEPATSFSAASFKIEPSLRQSDTSIPFGLGEFDMDPVIISSELFPRKSGETAQPPVNAKIIPITK